MFFFREVRKFMDNVKGERDEVTFCSDDKTQTCSDDELKCCLVYSFSGISGCFCMCVKAAKSGQTADLPASTAYLSQNLNRYTVPGRAGLLLALATLMTHLHSVGLDQQSLAHSSL